MDGFEDKTASIIIGAHGTEDLHFEVPRGARPHVVYIEPAHLAWFRAGGIPTCLVRVENAGKGRLARRRKYFVRLEFARDASLERG